MKNSVPSCHWHGNISLVYQTTNLNKKYQFSLSLSIVKVTSAMDHLNLTQNETLNSLEFETDYFRSLYESRISKWVFVSAVIMLLPINIMLLYSVTWYVFYLIFLSH